jgi:L-ribulose-5-phosphate 3-epimerase
MKRGYNLGLYEKALPPELGFRGMLESTRQSGFDCLEISIDESDKRLERLEWPSQKRRELREICDSLGVRIWTMCLSGHRRFPLGSHDKSMRARSLEIMKKAVQLSTDIGVRIIQLAGYDVYYEEGDRDTEKWFSENLSRSVEIAAGSGVILGFETMETPFMDTVGKAMKYVGLIGSPYLGVYPDIGNLKNAAVKYDGDLIGDIKLGRGHCFAAHLKETVPGIYRDRSFGDGHTEYIPCIEELWVQGVRMYTGEFWYHGEKNYMQTLTRSGQFLRDKIEKAAALCEDKTTNEQKSPE